MAALRWAVDADAGDGVPAGRRAGRVLVAVRAAQPRPVTRPPRCCATIRRPGSRRSTSAAVVHAVPRAAPEHWARAGRIMRARNGTLRYPFGAAVWGMTTGPWGAPDDAARWARIRGTWRWPG